MSIKIELSEIKRIRGFSLDGLLSGLPRPRALSWLPPLIDSRVARSLIEERVPVDGEEVVGWMHYATADMAVFDVYAQAVEGNGGEVRFTSGDAYIPGVRLSSTFYGASEIGSTVVGRGYGRVATPYGEVQVPVNRKRTIVFKDFLAWAIIPWAGAVQWALSLLQYAKLPRAPIRDKLPFPSSHGMTAPNFVVASTRIPAPVAVMRINVTSDRDQGMIVRGRSPSDYTKVYFEDKIDVEQGEAEYAFTLASFPIVPSLVLELQPEDNTQTTLNKLEVFP